MVHPKIQSLCGIKAGQREAHFPCNGLRTPDLKIIANELDCGRAMAHLTILDLSGNQLTGGHIDYATGVVNAGTPLGKMCTPRI